MYLVQQITADAQQNMRLLHPVLGKPISLTLEYRSNQYGWYITSLTYDDKSFAIGTIRIVAHPNLLHQWKNILPFGLACYTTNNREPSQRGDFVNGDAELFVLDASEVAAYVGYLANG